MEASIRQLQDQLVTATGRQDELEMSKSALEVDLRRLDATHQDKERDCRVLVKDFEYAKERETVLMVDRLAI